MQIYANSQSQSLNFGMMRVRQLDGSTRRINAQGKDMVTKIWGDVMNKGKLIEKFSYEKKEGFDGEDIAEIVEALCANAKNKKNAIVTTMGYLYSDDHNVDVYA